MVAGGVGFDGLIGVEGVAGFAVPKGSVPVGASPAVGFGAVGGAGAVSDIPSNSTSKINVDFAGILSFACSPLRKLIRNNQPPLSPNPHPLETRVPPADHSAAPHKET